MPVASAGTRGAADDAWSASCGPGDAAGGPVIATATAGQAIRMAAALSTAAASIASRIPVGGAVRVRHQFVNALDRDVRQQVKDRYVPLGNGITQLAEILGDRVSSTAMPVRSPEAVRSAKSSSTVSSSRFHGQTARWPWVLGNRCRVLSETVCLRSALGRG